MKTLLQKSFIIMAALLSFNSKAQTAVNLYYFSDTTSITYNCTLPYTSYFTLAGTATGYNPATDQMNIHIFWGDGTDTTFLTGIIDDVPDYFMSFPSHIFYTPGNYYPMVIATGPDGTDDTLNGNPLALTNACVTIDGYCYQDNNANCVFDAGDDTLSYIPLIIRDNTGNAIGYAYTNSSGYYSMGIEPGLTGLQIKPNIFYGPSAFYAVTCPASGSYTFNSNVSTSFNFGISCSSASYDLYIYHGFSGVGVPGGTGMISFSAGIYSCSTTPYAITLTLDPNVTYTGMISGPAPSSVAGNILTWNSIIAPSFNAMLNILTNTSATVLSPACFTVSISPTAGDLTPANNSNTLCLQIGGPYDPNNKEVSPAGNIAPSTELTYTINFQNTGTAPAHNIYVMDTISSNLDMSTFQVIGSSHAMTPYFYSGNIIRFDYQNIMLPDSNANEALSHGWVIYKIKTKSGLANGTQINNTGHIFFDYNPAIVTNTTVNTIDLAMGINEISNNTTANIIYPNPAQNAVTIKFEKAISGTLSVFDTEGRVVKMLKINDANEVSLNISDLSSGLYGLVIPGIPLKENRLHVVR